MGEDEAKAVAPRHAARLETMANLARPVQHEINNLLTVIFANLEMLKRTAAEGAPQRQLDRVAEAARRFEASSRGFLSLSRRPVPGVSVFTLHEALVALRPLLVVLMPTPSMLAIEADLESGPVRMDRALLGRGADRARARGGRDLAPGRGAVLVRRQPAGVAGDGGTRGAVAGGGRASRDRGALRASCGMRAVGRRSGSADGFVLLKLALPRSTGASE